MLTSVSLQSQSIGIRAGLNTATFSGPLEAGTNILGDTGESFGYSNGFHFGVNYGYKLSDYVTIRGEVVYTQIGGKQFYDGESYYRIYGPNETFYEFGTANIELDISNAYISVPITAVGMLGKKIEVFGGAYFSFLVNPVGGGTHRFESTDNPEDVLFRQGLNYDYYADQAQGGQTFTRNIRVRVGEEIISIVQNAGAYYQYESKNGSKFNWFDAGLTVGTNYFINRGFFIGGRLNYGLLDITNDDMDISLRSIDENNARILRDDRDLNFALEFSVGFKF